MNQSQNEKELIEPMEFFKIDKICDDVYTMSINVVLKFNVSLSKTSNGKRYHFHKEFEYPSKSDDVPSLVTIKRSFDYYLSIESIQKDNAGNKIFIRIGPSEFIMFRKGLETAISWFTDSKFKNLYAKNKGQLIMMPPIPSFTIPRLPMNKYIEISPTIIDRGMANEDKEPGIQMILGNETDIINMTLDRLMGLYYIISCFNMYQSAIELINYIDRPPFGTNRYVINQPNHTMSFSDSAPKSKTAGVEGRFVTPKHKKQSIETLEG